MASIENVRFAQLVGRSLDVGDMVGVRVSQRTPSGIRGPAPRTLREGKALRSIRRSPTMPHWCIG